MNVSLCLQLAEFLQLLREASDSGSAVIANPDPLKSPVAPGKK